MNKFLDPPLKLIGKPIQGSLPTQSLNSSTTEAEKQSLSITNKVGIVYNQHVHTLPDNNIE